MAASRNVAVRDEEKLKEDDSPTAKKPKFERFPLTKWELAAALGIFLVCSTGLVCVYLTMPSAEYQSVKLPRTLSDLRMLKDLFANYAKDHPAQFILGYCSTYIFMQTFMIPGTIFMSLLAGALFGVIRGLLFNIDQHLDLFANYAKDHPAQFILGYCSTYIFMQTFMIPGTIFMSLLAGALFGVIRGLLLVVFNATAGASSCFFLSKLIGRPLVYWMWPEKLKLFQAEIAKHREKLLNYMLFLRITPTLPNLFINLASPIVDIPFHVFFLATLIGLVPASYITVRAGLALGDLKSVKDLYDFKTLSVLFFIGFISILPTLLKRKRVYE